MLSDASSSTPFRVELCRRARPSAPADVARAVHAALCALGDQHPACSSWFAKDRGFQVWRCSRLDEIVSQIESGEIEWDDGMRSPTAPSHQTRFFNGSVGDDLVDVSIAFALDGDPRGPYWGVRIELHLGAAFGGGAPADAACRLRALFEAFVTGIEPDWASLGLGQAPARIGHRVLAGWLTYIAGGGLADRTLLLPAELHRLGMLGHVIVAHPELLREDTRGYGEAVRAVQRAIDGEKEAPTAPAFTLRNQSEAPRARRADAQRAGETEELDVSVLRRAMLPFMEGAPSAEFFAAADAARPRRSERRAVRAGYDETMRLPVLTRDSTAGDTTGHATREMFAATAAAEPAVPLSLEQYAAFCAEIAVFPEHVAIIYQRYGVADVDARRALGEAFAQRFRVDRRSYHRWRALVVHYGDWYRHRGAR